jgi:hypothetical protein
MIGSNSRRLVLPAALLVLLLVPHVALADAPAAPPTPEQIEAARAAYKEARDLHKQGRLKEALEKAQQALDLAATPVTALEVGRMQVESGHLVDARDVLRSVALLPVSPRESDKGREARAQAASLAGQLDMRIPKIAFASRPAAVEVLLDGKAVAFTDPTAWLGVDPGAHSLAVRVDDRPCTTVTLSLSEGEERTVDLHDAAAACRPEPPAPAPSPRASQVAPVAPPVYPPESPPAAPASGDSGAWKLTSAVLAGAGVVAVGVGGYLALGAKSDYDAVAGECGARGCNQDGFDARNRARSRADVASVVMGIGGAAVVAGAVLWFAAPSARVRVGVGSGVALVSGALP